MLYFSQIKGDGDDDFTVFLSLSIIIPHQISPYLSPYTVFFPILIPHQNQIFQITILKKTHSLDYPLIHPIHSPWLHWSLPFGHQPWLENPPFSSMSYPWKYRYLCCFFQPATIDDLWVDTQYHVLYPILWADIPFYYPIWYSNDIHR